MSSQPEKSDGKNRAQLHPFRTAVFRGLAIVMPTLLTIVVFIWVWTTIDAYLLKPVESFVTYVWVQRTWKVMDDVPDGVQSRPIDGREKFSHDNTIYVQLENGKWIPETVYEDVNKESADFNLKTATAKEVYEQYIKNKHLERYKTIPIFLFVFVVLLYTLGKFLAAGMGNFAGNVFERLIHRLPIIRTVYSAAKQVTDFVFKEQEVEFTRVVALQYPRKGIWSMGFVTGESFLDIRSAVNEPVLSVLMPTSPMPATGFTVTIPKSETVDLDISIDQAIQFCVSCGVVVPAHQQYSNQEIAARMVAAVGKLDGKVQGSDEAVRQPAGIADKSNGGT